MNSNAGGRRPLALHFAPKQPGQQDPNDLRRGLQGVAITVARHQGSCRPSSPRRRPSQGRLLRQSETPTKTNICCQRLVLEALDTARTQMYHMKALVIAAMAFFCISSVSSKLLVRLDYPDSNAGDNKKPGTLHVTVNNMVIAVTLVVTLVLGYFSYKLSRNRVITLVLMAACAIGSGLSFRRTSHAVMGTLCLLRFWLGFGIGGDYPLSAIIMSK
ncbi:hypothetical protein U9M48_042043 [Paspalum notatum var. saurae]|uniref:Major facilitator superfamily (MFS) profile domain-containing protein n=1 Tax=Paspalum notatum var. saurae TaxID=547442 RepID=A0AAQ3XEU5_PASNO